MATYEEALAARDYIVATYDLTAGVAKVDDGFGESWIVAVTVVLPDELAKVPVSLVGSAPIRAFGR
jgi:hypothetical protein